MIPDPFLRREGDDIHLDVSITAAEAALGARISIPGPLEPLVLNLPRGTRSGTVFRFAGQGFPSLGNCRRGHFYVRTRVVPY
jgi:DnaJ-class molecular chaperone